MTESLVGGASAAPLSMRATAVVASAIVRAARQLLTDLERGRRVDAAVLRNAMEAAFAASNATGTWNWKMAYAAGHAGPLPAEPRRWEKRKTRQQCSTPIEPVYVARVAAPTAPADVVLEPSAGT